MRLLREDNAYLRERLAKLAAEYNARIAAAGVSARIAAERAWAAEREELQRQSAEAVAAERQASHAAATAKLEAESANKEQQVAHATAMAQLQERHSSELAAVRAECASELGLREEQHTSLLAELRQLRSAMTSRASTPDASNSRDGRMASMPPGQLQDGMDNEMVAGCWHPQRLQQQRPARESEWQPRVPPRQLQQLSRTPRLVQPGRQS